MSSLTLEDPNNTAEAQTGLHATTPDQGEFSGGCILQVAPNLSGNRTPHHFVDGIQGIGGTSGGRGVVGQAIMDFPGVSGDAQRIGVLGNGNDAGVLGLVGFRNGTFGIPGPPITVVFPGDPSGTPSDIGQPAGTETFQLENVGFLSAGVVGMAADTQAFRPPVPARAGVLGINRLQHALVPGPVGAGVVGHSIGIGDGVVGQSGNGIAVSGTSTDTNANGTDGSSGRGGVFASRINAQIRLAPLQRQDTTDPHNALPKDGVAGDLIAITVTVVGVSPPEVTSLWFCTNSGNPANAVWKQLA